MEPVPTYSVQAFIAHAFKHLLSVADALRVSQVSRWALEIRRGYAEVLDFACACRDFGPDRSCIRDWLRVHDSFLSITKRCGLESFKRISYKHTLQTESDTFLPPLEWRFKPGSLEPFIMFLWQELTTKSSKTGMSCGTFVNFVGRQGREIGRPKGIIALDATCCDGAQEHFNLAALLLLDDGLSALILSWAVHVSASEGFFGIVFIGELNEVVERASSIFHSPCWAWKEERLQWFGFDISIPYSFEHASKLELLRKLPPLWAALGSEDHLDLQHFHALMHGLHPGDVPPHPEAKKSWWEHLVNADVNGF